METPETSIETFRELKENGVIKERQELAFKTVKRFYEEYEFWPTQREAHVFLVEELDLLDKEQRTRVITDGYRYIGRRMGELVHGEDNYPDLLEKEEKREHKYLQEEHPIADSGREGEPHKIPGFEEESTESDSHRDEAEVEDIPYQMDGGSTVTQGPPSEAIQNTDDLDAVVEILEKNGLAERYSQEIQAARQEEDEPEPESTGDDDFVEKDGEQYLFDPDEEQEPDQEDEEPAPTEDKEESDQENQERKQGKLLYDQGEVVG